VAAFLIPAYVFAASCDSEEGIDPTEADIQQFTEIMVFFGGIMEGEEPPPCATVTETETQTSLTMSVTFNNCDFEGIIVNGSFTLTLNMVSECVYTISYSGSVTMSGTGAPAESVAFNLTMTIDSCAATFEEGVSVSGTVTIDGTVFKASGFLEELYYYGY
jgi:hypothetical protein